MTSVLHKLLASLMPLLLLAGCSGKKEDDKKRDDSGPKIMDKEEGPPKTKPKPPEKETAKDKDDTPPPDQPAGGRITGEKIGDEFRNDVKAATAKYNDKLLELTSPIEEIGVSATGEAYLVVEGTQIPTPQRIECYTTDKEPWTRAAPGQTVKLKGRCRIIGGELKFIDCQILDATGPMPIRVKAAELAEAYEKDAAAAGKTHEGKWLEVTGEVEKVDRVEAADKAVLTLKKSGKLPISCILEGGLADQTRKLTAGQTVKLLGRQKAFDAESGIELLSCVLIAKP